MRRRMSGLLTGAALCLLTGTAQGQQTAPQEIEARSWSDRTALWVGDRFLYTIEIDCAPTIDIVSADLAGEKLSLTGLEVVDSSSERSVADSGRLTYRFVYRLTTYEPGAGARGVADLTVRYGKRRAGQRMDEATPAGEIVVPGVAVALRSTLPEDVKTIDARDRRPLVPVPTWLTLARPVGIALILLSAAPVLLWAGALLQRTRATRKRRDTRAARTDGRTALAEIAQGDYTTDAARRDAYTRLAAVVRDHVSLVAGLPARALTSAEIGQRLGASRSNLPAETVTMLLDECERARYGPPHVMPPAARVPEAVVDAERILAVSR